MSSTPYAPAILEHADFALARFTLDLLGPCRLDPYALLGLRRGLLRAARILTKAQSDQLFAPVLSSDPVALRRFQKPSPAFVLRPDLLRGAVFQEGDSFELEVLFLGDGLRMINTFARVLRNLGKDGLVDGEGSFEIAGVSFCSATGNWHARQPIPDKSDIPCEVLSLGVLLDALLPLPGALCLKLATPTRLVNDGRALRRPHFAQLLPFMLRRVTSMLYYHCHLEPVDDPAAFLVLADRVKTIWDEATWVDWRELGEQRAAHKVGGLTGSLRVAAVEMDDLGWVVALATLFGIGRGAAYGAGQVGFFSANKGLSP